MSSEPKVIGFVPAYNAEKFILKTLDALAKQTYSNFEILLCDDASSDGTAEICKDFCHKDPRFIFSQNSKNQGWIRTSERLWLESAKESKYCFINPHDDLPYPDFISELVRLMEENPKASLAIPGMENEYWDNSIIKAFYTHASDIENVVDRCFEVSKKDKVFWWAAYHGLHRSEFIPKIYPIDKLAFGEKEFSLDLISLLKIAFFGTLVTSEKILLKKVYSKTSVSTQWNHNTLNNAALWWAILKEIKKSPLSMNQKIQLKLKLYHLLMSRIINRAKNLFK
jgi:glycosyltransferase involved in cell wall biosynthesis